MNLEERVPVLISWSNGFAFGQPTKVTPRRLTLELQHHPKGVHGKTWFVCCRKVIGDVDAKGKLVWCLGLPVRTETAARMIVADIQAQLEYKRKPASSSALSGTQPDLSESQLRFLAKQYPRAVAQFRATGLQPTAEESSRLRDDPARTFAEEVFACSKVLLEPVDDEDQLLRMAHLFAKLDARKRKPDAVEYELIVGCYAKGYCQIKLEQLREVVSKAVGYEITTDALRHKWKRLGLPSARHRGRPKRTVVK